MADDDPEAGHGFIFYTYTYGDDLKRTARAFYETVEDLRRDLVAFRKLLISEEDREEPLRDMTIVRLRTKPVTRRALVELFNGMDGDLGGFVLSREAVEVVREPQLVRAS